jgi:mannose-6-phosphate isomerase-like protein (cupin superfamily)
MVRRSDNYHWEGVEVLPYKEDSNIFKSVTRQVLSHGGHDLPVELRYFEVGPAGHSTLERHQHAHLVVIARGSGQVMVGDEVTSIGLNDVVEVPPMTWHQFRAGNDEPLGFLCVVSAQRDKAQRPDPSQVEELQANPVVGSFIRV